MLWTAAEMQGYACPFWLTFQQTKELGGFVKKGEHGSPVVYASRFTKKEAGENGDEVEREIPFLKEYTVFNASQCEGLPEHFYRLAETPQHDMQRIERAETFFKNTRADIRSGGNMAYYAMGSDHVQMPPFETFRDAESHAATLAHELTHWTRHPTRLAREFGRKRWGDEVVCDGGIGRRAWLRVPLCRPDDHARSTRGPRQLSGQLAPGVEGGQAGHLFGGEPRRASD